MNQPAPVRTMIPYTELPDSVPGSPLAPEWDAYRREVGRLLGEGHEGKFVLVKGGKIIGLFDTNNAAMTAGYAQFGRTEFLVHKIQREERILRMRI